MSEGPPSPKRLRLDLEDIESLSRDDLIEKLRELNDHVSYLGGKQRGSLDKDDGEDKEGDDKKQPSVDSSRRENTLVLRLTNKEQELQDCLNQIAEMKASQTQNSAQLRSLLLDPAVNLVFQRMAKEMDDCKEKLKQTQNELNAWKFTADSQMGKRLMAKCRMLLQENEELGKMISSGRTSKLEAEIALQRTMVTEMKSNQDEMNEFVVELEEDVEGMQSMIYVLQQQLKDTKDSLASLQTDNARLRSLSNTPSNVPSNPPTPVSTPGAQPDPAVAPADISGRTGASSGAETAGSKGGEGGGVGTPQPPANPVVPGASDIKVRTPVEPPVSPGAGVGSLPPPPHPETAQQPAVAGAKRTSGGDHPPTPTPTPTPTPLPTPTNSDTQQQQPNGRTEAPGDKSSRNCSSLAQTETDGRADQACEVMTPSLGVKVVKAAALADSPSKDSKQPPSAETKPLTPDKPLRNGGLDTQLKLSAVVKSEEA